MERKFAVGASDLTDFQQKELIAYFKESKVAWWHWIKGMWLVRDRHGLITAKQIRDKLKQISPNGRCMIVEVKGKTSWAGFGPSSGDKSMFKWMRDAWDSDTPTDKGES